MKGTKTLTAGKWHKQLMIASNALLIPTATGGEPQGRKMMLPQPRNHTFLEIVSTLKEVIGLRDSTAYYRDA